MLSSLMILSPKPLLSTKVQHIPNKIKPYLYYFTDVNDRNFLMNIINIQLFAEEKKRESPGSPSLHNNASDPIKTSALFFTQTGKGHGP